MKGIAAKMIAWIKKRLSLLRNMQDSLLSGVRKHRPSFRQHTPSSELQTLFSARTSRDTSLSAEEESLFREEMKNALIMFQTAQLLFEQAEADQVDFAIYEIEATRRRYEYMIKKAREFGIRSI